MLDYDYFSVLESNRVFSRTLFFHFFSLSTIKFFASSNPPAHFFFFFPRATRTDGHDDPLGPCFVLVSRRCRYIKYSGLDIPTPIHLSSRAFTRSKRKEASSSWASDRHVRAPRSLEAKPEGLAGGRSPAGTVAPADVAIVRRCSISFHDGFRRKAHKLRSFAKAKPEEDLF